MSATKQELDNAERHARYLKTVWERIEQNSQAGAAAAVITDGIAGMLVKIDAERAALADAAVDAPAAPEVAEG